MENNCVYLAQISERLAVCDLWLRVVIYRLENIFLRIRCDFEMRVNVYVDI